MNQHPLAATASHYSEDLKVLQSLQALEWEWFEDPSQYPFLRLIKGSGNRKKITAGYLDSKKTHKIIVGVGRQDGQSLVLAYRKPNDFSCDAYKVFSDQNPFAKPMEAVDTRVLAKLITPEASLEISANYRATTEKTMPKQTPQQVAEQTRRVAVKSVDAFEQRAVEQRIVWLLLHDLTDRSGFRQLFDSLPRPVQEEIQQTWEEIVKAELQPKDGNAS